jgi:hypothetical protein
VELEEHFILKHLLFHILADQALHVVKVIHNQEDLVDLMDSFLPLEDILLAVSEVLEEDLLMAQGALLQR